MRIRPETGFKSTRWAFWPPPCFIKGYKGSTEQWTILVSLKFDRCPGAEVPKAAAAGEKSGPSAHDSILYVSLGICVLALVSLHDFSPKISAIEKAKAKSGQMDLSSKSSPGLPRDPVNESITRHMQDAEVRRDLMMRAREIENLQANKGSGLDDITSLPETKEYGVRLDADESMDRVFEAPMRQQRRSWHAPRRQN